MNECIPVLRQTPAVPELPATGTEVPARPETRSAFPQIVGTLLIGGAAIKPRSGYKPRPGTPAAAALTFLTANPGSKVDAISRGTGIDVETLYGALQLLQRNERVVGQTYLGNRKEWTAV